MEDHRRPRNLMMVPLVIGHWEASGDNVTMGNRTRQSTTQWGSRRKEGFAWGNGDVSRGHVKEMKATIEKLAETSAVAKGGNNRRLWEVQYPVKRYVGI